ncbi:hypothetical protein [Nitrospirillum bahiense]|uniref:Phage regulatory protein CII n=1 Tax=Nitrospirillum amazonense TaxID=28077 RepID=A0A560F278_9PROT|nr:hypothetical protein [Nitrospirillum amazonense]TWB15615.1 hypothetical protein FBZ88_12968 [Nitrospirillum amazonense]
MTKLREPLSFEDAVELCLGVLGKGPVMAATNRQYPTVKGWTDADKNKPIPAMMASILDCAMVRAGYAPPFLAVMNAAVDRARRDAHIIAAPHVRLVECLTTLGKISQEISTAMHPDSDGGATLTKAELAGILLAIDADAEALGRLRRDVLALQAGAP